MSSSIRRVVRIRVLSSVVVKCRVVGIRVLSLALLCWGWVSVPRARHREWLPLPWSQCDDRAGRRTFNVPNSRDWVLSLAQRGYGFGPLAGTLQHLAIRLFVGHSLTTRLNGPLQPKSGSDPLLPCAREVHTHTHTRTHTHRHTHTLGSVVCAHGWMPTRDITTLAAQAHWNVMSWSQHARSRLLQPCM